MLHKYRPKINEFSVLIGSLGNFFLQFYSYVFFGNSTDTAAFLADLSLGLLLASFLINTNVFRSSNFTGLIKIDALCLALVFFALGLVFIRSSHPLFVIYFLILTIYKDIVRIASPKIDTSFPGAFFLFIVFFGYLLLLLNYDVNLKTIPALLLIFASQFFIIISRFNIYQHLSISLRVSDIRDFAFSTSIELLNLFSSIFLLVVLADYMTPQDFIKFRQLLAAGSISGLIGTVSLSYIYRTGVDIKHLKYVFVGLAFSCLVILSLSAKSFLFLVAAYVVVFGISSVLHSYNKLRLARNQYFWVSCLSPILVVPVSFFLLRISIEITFFGLILVQFIHILLSFFSYRNI